MSAAAVTAAHADGNTLLPLPQGVQPIDSLSNILPEGPATRSLTPKQQEQLQLLESAALTWTRQIKQALRAPTFESLEVGILLPHLGLLWCWKPPR